MPPKKRQSPEASKNHEVAGSVSDQKLEIITAQDTSDAVDLAARPLDALKQSDYDSTIVIATSPSPPPAKRPAGIYDTDSTAPVKDDSDYKGTITLPGSPAQIAIRNPTPVSSPTNKEKFQATLYVKNQGCDVEACTAGPNVRLTFIGTIVVLYPISMNPERRYVVFMDENGFTGITIWNANVKKITHNSIGNLCTISKVSVNSYHGKRSLNMSKESEVRLIVDDNDELEIIMMMMTVVVLIMMMMLMTLMMMLMM